jgi:hypothetical protein
VRWAARGFVNTRPDPHNNLVVRVHNDLDPHENMSEKKINKMDEILLLTLDQLLQYCKSVM